ncbi:hypothetical protein ACFL1X_10590 [Candidatus Hydrogenedentota bacterium]
MKKLVVAFMLVMTVPLSGFGESTISELWKEAKNSDLWRAAEERDFDAIVDSTKEMIPHYEKGKWVYYYANGQKQCEGPTRFLRMHGKWAFWYENGKKKSEGDYANNKPDGKWTRWHDNGKKASEGNMVGGKGDGRWTHWHKNGNKYSEASYADGKQDGKWTRWHDNGQKRSEGNYLNGNADGEWIRWHDNGQKRSEGIYLDGNVEGKWIQFHDNGQIEAEGSYLDGTIDGEWKQWYANGNKSSERFYKEGKLHGECVGWHVNGIKGWEGSFIEGEGKAVYYDENGRKTGDSNCQEYNVDGYTVTGTVRYWHENGVKRAVGSFEEGKHDGVWTFWLANGEKECEKVFEVGKLVKLNGEEISVGSYVIWSWIWDASRDRLAMIVYDYVARAHGTRVLSLEKGTVQIIGEDVSDKSFQPSFWFMPDENKYLMWVMRKESGDKSAKEMRVYSTDGSDPVIHDMSGIGMGAMTDDRENLYSVRSDESTDKKTLVRMSLAEGNLAAKEVYSSEEQMTCLGVTKGERHLLFKTFHPRDTDNKDDQPLDTKGTSRLFALDLTTGVAQDLGVESGSLDVELMTQPSDEGHPTTEIFAELRDEHFKLQSVIRFNGEDFSQIGEPLELLEDKCFKPGYGFDGRYVFYGSHPRHDHIEVRSIEGGMSQRICQEVEHIHNFAVSSDGSYLAYSIGGFLKIFKLSLLPKSEDDHRMIECALYGIYSLDDIFEGKFRPLDLTASAL